MNTKTIARALVGLSTAVLAAAGLTTPAQAATYPEFIAFTNTVLDGFEAQKGGSAGFRAGRALFNEPRYAQMDWNGGGLLCRYFRGDSTAEGAKGAAEAVWPVEKVILDTFREAGGAVSDWQDLMLVRFTVLSSSINAQCPSYNSLVMGPFSDALYALFDAYRATQGAPPNPSTTTPPASTPSGGDYGTVTVLSRPLFLGTVDDGMYTRIRFPIPTVWDTWGVTYTARFASNDKVFCRWTAVVDQVDFGTPGEGNCAGTRTKKLRGKTRWMYIEATSDLGKVTSEHFPVTFSRSKWGD